jgi:hypothetical protein
VSGGTFQLVSEHTGLCLYTSGYTAPTAECDKSAQQTWRWGSGGTLQNMGNSWCLDESSGWPATNSCTSGKASQRWTKE